MIVLFKVVLHSVSCGIEFIFGDLVFGTAVNVEDYRRPKLVS